jgi:hypothetical protein
MTSAMIYSVRFAEKLNLPKLIMENISKLRLVPAAYRPIRPQKKMSKQTEDNWRTKLLVDIVRRVRETDDTQYDEILSIFNKIAPPTLDSLSAEALTILKSRDKEFCLRVTTLLFDKAIKQSFYAGLMADLAQRLNAQIPEISDDLETHAQMFTSIYDMSETLLFPKIEDPGFKDKVILWAKQKDVRRGYARFLTHLFTRGLITGRALQESMQKVLEDLQNTVVEPKSEQSEENVTQFADFIFEIAKLLKPSAIELRGLISTKLQEILGRPRPELSSLNMRSRFKLEDAVKCVQKV